MHYLCWNEDAPETKVEAKNAEAAAEKFFAAGDWTAGKETSYEDVHVTVDLDEVIKIVGTEYETSEHPGYRWVYGVGVGYDVSSLHQAFPGVRFAVDKDGDMLVEPSGGTERFTFTIDPPAPKCSSGASHDWRSPHEVLGGLRENPGVRGHGGSVIVTTVCAHCGAYRVDDDWAQRADTGEQGLSSVSYLPADAASLAWSKKEKEE